MHQRRRARAGRLLRTSDGEPRPASRRRATRGRRLELRSAEEQALVFPHHYLRAGGATRVRASCRVRTGDRGGQTARPGVFARAPLFRRLSTGEVASPAFLELAFPPRYHYDILRALDYLRAAGVEPDTRMSDAGRSSRTSGRMMVDGSSIARTTRRSRCRSAKQLVNLAGGTRFGRCA